MIYKILKQNNLYHNPDPLFRLIGEVNESIVMVEGQEARAVLDSGSQLSAISLEWVKKLKLRPQVTVNFADRRFRRLGSVLSGLCGGLS